MSLTNPNNVVTEERLSEFYGQILPYLGGMPDLLANKFSKSDLYSTDEKMIGQWINGKPLYQKTVDFGALPNATTKEVSANITDIDMLVDMRIFMQGGEGNTKFAQSIPYVSNNSTGAIEATFNYSDTKIVILTSRDRTSQTAFVTLWYTKSTDGIVAIGNDTDYSTEEKIVGTWIDGKPIYQKTFTANGTMSSGAELGTIDNLKRVIKLDGGFMDSNNSHGIFPWVYTNQFADVFVDSGNNKVMIVFNQTVKDPIVTVQYTKTTD